MTILGWLLVVFVGIPMLILTGAALVAVWWQMIRLVVDLWPWKKRKVRYWMFE